MSLKAEAATRGSCAMWLLGSTKPYWGGTFLAKVPYHWGKCFNFSNGVGGFSHLSFPWFFLELMTFTLRYPEKSKVRSDPWSILGSTSTHSLVLYNSRASRVDMCKHCWPFLSCGCSFHKNTHVHSFYQQRSSILSPGCLLFLHSFLPSASSPGCLGVKTSWGCLKEKDIPRQTCVFWPCDLWHLCWLVHGVTECGKETSTPGTHKHRNTWTHTGTMCHPQNIQVLSA